MKKSFFRRAVLAIICYLGFSAFFATYVEAQFRHDLSHHLFLIGGEHFIETEKLASYLKSDPSLHRYWGMLKVLPPLGWIMIRRLEHLEDFVIFASKNYALPENQRFPDAGECKRFGFDPEKKSDEDIRNVLFPHVAFP